MDHKQAKRTILIVGLILLSVCWLAPMITVVLTSLKSKQDFFSGMGLFAVPEEICWSNFVKAFTKGRLFRYMLNDLIVCIIKVPLGILVEAAAAFALTRTKIRRRTAIFIFFLVGMMLPMQVSLVPINVIYNKLGLINTYTGLIFAYIGFGIPLGILILRGFMRSIPKELDEAATIDGCNKWMLFWRIILPAAKPAIATLIITDFLATWNEYLLASVIITDNALKTVPVGLMTFVGEHGTDYGLLCAGVLICLLPVLIVYLIFQKYFVDGMAGAVKG